MDHECRYLCSELVTVIYEEQPGELCHASANLEEISMTSATVLMDEKPRLGSPISLTLRGCDLFGLITSSLYDAILGWFLTITLDANSTWRGECHSPQHLLAVCSCSCEDLTPAEARALETSKVTEENALVSFLARHA
jgi:hypothetical protein